MLRVSVRSCSFLFYAPVDVRPCGWCRSVLCCHVLFLCVAGSFTVFTVGCCYTVDWVFFVYCVKLVLSLYCGCSLQDTCTIDWSYITYCYSSTVSVLCYLHCMYILAFSFCVVASSALLYISTVCLILPCWKRFPVFLSWSGSLSLSWLVGVLVGAGWLG